MRVCVCVCVCACVYVCVCVCVCVQAHKEVHMATFLNINSNQKTIYSCV